jgi:hypothetical protein
MERVIGIASNPGEVVKDGSLPHVQESSRLHTANRREVMNAIFYMLKTGCHWHTIMLAQKFKFRYTF